MSNQTNPSRMTNVNKPVTNTNTNTTSINRSNVVNNSENSNSVAGGANIAGFSRISEKILETDITRINGYLRLVNIVFGSIFGLTGIIGLFRIHSYGDFLIIVYIMLLSALFVGFEFREKFPVLCEKVKRNFAFLFTAFGRAIYIIAIGFLAFTQGGFGIFLGICFILLASFNFFIIYKHPGYKEIMTEPTSPVIPALTGKNPGKTSTPNRNTTKLNNVDAAV